MQEKWLSLENNRSIIINLMQDIFDIKLIMHYIIYCKEDCMKNKRLKMARIERDMKQADLAEAVGVTRQTIGMIESGNYNPTLNLCISICKVLGKTLDDLFWEEEK